MLCRDAFVRLEKLSCREPNRLVAVTNGMIHGCDPNLRDVRKEVDGIAGVTVAIHRTVVQGKMEFNLDTIQPAHTDSFHFAAHLVRVAVILHRAVPRHQMQNVDGLTVNKAVEESHPFHRDVIRNVHHRRNVVIHQVSFLFIENLSLSRLYT